MMTPVGRLILLRSFPRSAFVTAMTYMTLPAIAGPVIGPLLGGALMAIELPLQLNFMAFAVPGAVAALAMTAFALNERRAMATVIPATSAQA